MKNLGITKGVLFKHSKYAKGNVVALLPNNTERSIASTFGYSTNTDNGEHHLENMNNADFIIDSFNTAQKCGLLPSELLKQRDELIKFVESFVGICEIEWHE